MWRSISWCLWPDGDEPAAADDSANDAIQMGSGTSDTPPEEPQASPTPQSEEDAAFADVLNTLDEFLQTDDGTASDEEAKPVITPSRATRG